MNELFDRVFDVIDIYGLHRSGAPVDLSPLEIICPIRYEDLTPLGIAGMCVATTPASLTTPAKIALCKTLTRPQRRVVYAHEAAHGLIGHSGSMRLADMDPWFTERQEREAWQAAALLLIPPLDLIHLTDMTLDGLARACEIPRWLVDLYP